MTLPTTFTGLVLPGHGQGDAVGARTANFDLALATDLAPGLYACHATLDHQDYRGLLYYGHNSLTGSDCLEVHFLNFTGNLYEKNITVTVDHYIREPKIFADPASLKLQIAADLRATNEYFLKK